MAPGHRSPFNHPPMLTNHTTPPRWREPLNGNPLARYESSLPAVAILLCALIVLLLVGFNIRDHLRHRHHHRLHQSVSSSPQPEMATSAQTFTDYMALRIAAGTRPARPHVRSLFRDRGSSISSVLQPLLPASNNDPMPIELNDAAKKFKSKGSINWHGSNMLNTAWGWMA